MLVLVAAGCFGGGGPSAADVARYANEAPDRLTVRVAESDGLAPEEAAADRFAADIARRLSARDIHASGYSDLCGKGPCTVYLEGSLEGPGQTDGYECETSVDIQLKGTEASVRREASFSCDKTRTLACLTRGFPVPGRLFEPIGATTPPPGEAST